MKTALLRWFAFSLFIGCGPTTGSTLADGGPALGCEPDDTGAIPLACGICDPGRFYYEGGCRYLCNLDHTLNNGQCPGVPVQGRPCTGVSGQRYYSGEDHAAFPGERYACFRLCINGRLTGAISTASDGHPCL